MSMNNWMAGIEGRDVKKLNSIVLPGSHDSGMNINEIIRHGFGLKSFTATQGSSIAAQLNAGIRWLDIRLSYEGVFWTKQRCYHGELRGVARAYGQTGRSVANEIMTFLNDNPEEVVIVLLTKSNDASYTQFLVDLAATEPSSKLPDLSVIKTRKIEDLTLAELAGRVIVVMDKPQKIHRDFWLKKANIVVAKLQKSKASVEVGHSNHTDYETNYWYDFILNTTGSYSEVNTVNEILDKQGTRSKNITGMRRNNYLMGVYYSTSTGFMGLRFNSSIKTDDHKMWGEGVDVSNSYRWLPNVVRVAFGSDNHPLFNCVMMDYATPQRCRAIRQYADKLGF